MGKGAAGGIGDIFGGGAGDVSGAGGDLLGGLGGGDPFSGMGGGLGDLTGGLGGGGFGDMFGSGMGDMSLLGGGTFGGLDTGNLTGAPSATNLGGQIQGQGLFNQAQGSPVTQGGQTFAGGGSVGPPETGIGDDLKQALGVPPAGPTGLGGPSAPYQASGPGMSLGGQTQAPIPSGAQSLTGNIPGSVAEPGGTPAFGGVTPFNAQSVQGMVNPATGNPAIAGTTLAGGNYGAQPSFGGALSGITAGDPSGIDNPDSAYNQNLLAQNAPSAAPAAAAAPAPAPVSTAASPAAQTNQAAANVTASQAATNGITQGLSQAGLPQQVIQMLGSLFSGLGGHNNPMGALGQMMSMLGGRGTRGSPQSQQGIAQVLTQLTRMGMPQQVVAMIGDLLSALSSHGNPTQLLQQLMQMLQGQGGQRQGGGASQGAGLYNSTDTGNTGIPGGGTDTGDAAANYAALGGT